MIYFRGAIAILNKICPVNENKKPSESGYMEYFSKSGLHEKVFSEIAAKVIGGSERCLYGRGQLVKLG